MPTPSQPAQSRRKFLLNAAKAASIFALAPVFRRAARAETTVTIIDFSPEGKRLGKVSRAKVIKTEAEWQRLLPSIAYDVTRRAGTERPYTGATYDLHDHGIFRCVCCDIALFSSETKFDSHTGWPSFWQPIARENVHDSTDDSIGMMRTAVSCPLCDAHLGHVFDDGPQPTGLRYCMNSAAMHFVKTV